MDITIKNIPDSVIKELNTMATLHGYSNVQEMIIALIRSEIKDYRYGNSAIDLSNKIGTEVENETWDMR